MTGTDESYHDHRPSQLLTRATGTFGSRPLHRRWELHGDALVGLAGDTAPGINFTYC